MLRLFLLISFFYFSGIETSAQKDSFYILTPPPPVQPQLNNSLVYGCRSGNDFLYRIPCQGERPIVFTVKGLPKSLRLDKNSGVISGKSPAKGTYQLNVIAKNKHGVNTKSFKIISGEKIALTPIMGWNHWYAYFDKPTDALIRQAADVMISNGLADAGYNYVCIDDCWTNAYEKNRMPIQDSLRLKRRRDSSGSILPNDYFPDMKAMTDYLHQKGFKAGIYSSPSKRTCAGFEGSFGYEEKDAKQWAQWGFDLIKYDRCSYPDDALYHTLEQAKYPYEKLGQALKTISRDIYYSLCQYYGSEKDGDVWKWGGSIGGNSWRTGTDINAFLPDVFKVALRNIQFAAYQKPGEWNDPDFLMLGWLGNRRTGGIYRTTMHPNTQYAYVSLWSLMASPLFFSSRIDKIDAFTLNLLTNHEIIAINQDPLGLCGRLVTLNEKQFLLVKELHDGATAVGIFNRDSTDMEIKINLKDIGLKETYDVRDCWRQVLIGHDLSSFQTTVPAIGCAVIKFSKTN